MNERDILLQVKGKALDKLARVGILDSFVLKAKNPKNEDWVAVYRSHSQFRNRNLGAIIWLSKNILNDQEESVISVLHEYGHAIAEWAAVRNGNLANIIQTNWVGEMYGRPWDEEEFAEDFARYCFGSFIYSSSEMKEVIRTYISDC